MYQLSNNPTYRLRVGDTLASIARRHGMRLADLTALNPKINPHAPRPGAVVRLPSLRATASAPPATIAAPEVPSPAKAAPVSDAIAMIADALAPVEAALIADDAPPTQIASMDAAAPEADDAMADTLQAAQTVEAVEAAEAYPIRVELPDALKSLLVGNFLPSTEATPDDTLAV